MCIVWRGEIVTYGIHLWAPRCVVALYDTYAQTIMHVYTRTPNQGKGAAQKGLEAGVCRDNSRALTVTTHRSEPLLSAPLESPYTPRLTVAPFSYGNAHRLTCDGLALIGPRMRSDGVTRATDR